ncbi:MAG TPA: protein translocase subunit SecF [bacterium]
MSMHWIKPDTKIPFVRIMKYTTGLVSITAILLAVLALVRHGGLIYGIDFKGGSNVELKFKQPVEIDAVRGGLDTVGLGKSEIKYFGDRQSVLLATEMSTTDVKGVEAEVRKALDGKFGAGAYEIQRVEMVGPKVGADLRAQAFWAVMVSLVLILGYITWRFEFKFALGAIVATTHDVVIALGLFTLLGKTFTLPVLAAILTIAGYSTNDTIVVFDRIRENLRRGARQTLGDTIDLSINETLSRTVLTALTVVIVLVALYVYGGEIIRDFAWVMLLGVLIGTYSSIFVASPIVLLWQGKGIRLRK